MDIDFTPQIIAEKEKKTLNKPFRTPSGPKKFSVYVKNEKGNIVKVNFGDPNMEIKRDDPNRRKNFRARHNCDNPGPKTKARYWSCRQWRAGTKVQGSEVEAEWDGETLFDHDELLTIYPALAYVEEEVTEECIDCDENSESDAVLSDKQKKLPPALQKAIQKKKGKNSENKNDDSKKSKPDFADVDKDGDKKEPMKKALKDKESKSSDPEEISEKDYASLWKNIHEKRERIKRGSGEKMRKKGEKGAPTSDQMKKAKGEKGIKVDPEGTGPYEVKEEFKATYEMSLEEYSEVMSMEDEILFGAKKRQGPKSAAQTPSKPSERKKGSSKNKPGSAGEKGGSITFSEKVLTSLKNKVKEHNAKSKKKVTLSQLKKVYRRGAGAFSQSHRPGMSRGGWAMARVNMFLKMKRGGKVKKSYRAADGDI